MDAWTFASGLVGPDDSVKGYAVDATDGPAGTVSWASYKPGESYLIVTARRRLRKAHYVIPASLVREIRKADRRVVLTVSRAEAHSHPHRQDPAAPLDPKIVAAFAGGAPGVIDGGLIV